MKITNLFAPLLLLTLAFSRSPAQDSPPPNNQPVTNAAAADSLNSQPPTLNAPPAPGEFAVTERGSDYRVFERSEFTTNKLGYVSEVKFSYTQLGTGMHFFREGQWQETREEILLLPDANGAAATNGPHKLFLPADIYQGAIEIIGPDGRTQRCRPMGIAYVQGSQSVLISELTNSVGQIVQNNNQVIYTNAFSDFQCDLLVTYRQRGIECDLVIRGRPPAPSLWNLPDSCQIQLLTEYFDTEAPVQKNVAVDGATGVASADLEFGAMHMRRGRAFSVGSRSSQSGVSQGTIQDVGASNSSSKPTPVQKTWEVIENRSFLIESAPYRELAPKLAELSAIKSPASRVAAAGNARETSATRFLTPKREVAKTKKKMELASTDLSQKSGVVLDWEQLSGGSNTFTFKGDKTYLITNLFALDNAIFEGGAVIKMKGDGSISLNSTTTFKNGPYRPTILTSKNDNTVGETISGSSGSPSPSDVSLMLQGSFFTNLSNMRFSHALQVMDNSWSILPLHVWNSQFVDVDKVIWGYNLNLHNVLISRPSSATGFGIENYGSFTAENVTADGNGTFACAEDTGGTVTFTLINCLVTEPNLIYDLNGGEDYTTIITNAVAHVPGTNPYQAVGAGNFYLAPNSPYRNSGSTSINSVTLADIRKKTTYSPIELTNDFTVDTTLCPQAQRDTDTPDLGYHYDPLDWVVSGRTLTNSTLTLTNGVALGTYGASNSYGILITKSGNLVSQGSPLNLNHITRYNTVQEQATPNWSATNVAPCLKGITLVTPYPQGHFRFTDWSLLGGIGYHFLGGKILTATPQYDFTDCQFGPGVFFAKSCSTAITNCLFERVSLTLDNDTDNRSYYVFNNLFRSGSLVALGIAGAAWIGKDNLFDQTTIPSQGGITHSNNAYVAGFNRLTPTNANDVVLTNAPVYLTSFLGKYYYPTNDGMLSLLINAGSRNATNAGLYHYTVMTNMVGGLQIKETNSVADIGFHYAAVGTSGSPIDTDSDGLPDYAEDVNGNGIQDPGETGFTNPDNDGDGLPDGWEMKYFGSTTLQNGSDDFDQDGVNNLAEYQNGTDPNNITFSTSFLSNHINTATVNCTLEIQAGVPAMMAALVNSTNFSSATWMPFNTNLNVNIGSTDGRYDVWIGLRGFPDDSDQYWIKTRITHDSVSPPIIITAPTNFTVSCPILQLRGYSPEALQGLSYDLTNAAGLLTNQPLVVLDRCYDTNDWEFTTNTFQAFDVGLTNGLNTITLHATDLAGNATVTNLSITLDYAIKTNPPVIKVYWPKDGAQIGATNITWRGWVDECTATITATRVDTNGVTNVFNGLVERDGNFWVQDLTLGNGTNMFTLTATDAAGNSSGTNLNIVNSTVALTIDPINESGLSSGTINLSGTISASGQTVWVNGMKATNNTDTTWTAQNVPITPGGTAVFQARAIPNSDHGGNGTDGSGSSPGYENPGNPISALATDEEIQIDKPPRLFVEHYTQATHWERKTQWHQFDAITGIEVCWGQSDLSSSGAYSWTDGAGGGGTFPTLQGSATDCEGTGTYGPCTENVQWPATYWPNLTSGTQDWTGDKCDWEVYTPIAPPPGIPYEDCRVDDSGNWHGTYLYDVLTQTYENWNIDEKFARGAHTKLKLFTGGKATPQRENLFVLSASGVQFLRDPSGIGIRYYPAREIRPERITIDRKQVGTDGLLYLVLPDNTTRDVTPEVKGMTYYTNQLGVTKHNLRILANGSDCSAENPPVFIVGQFVQFNPDWNPAPPGITNTSYLWRFYGSYFNQIQIRCPDCSSNYVRNPDFLTNAAPVNWWVSGNFIPPTSYPVMLKERLSFDNGQNATVSVDGHFRMYRPKAKVSPLTTSIRVSSDLISFDSAPADGITFSNTLTLPAGFSGSAKWVQVDSSTYGEFRDVTNNYIFVEDGPAPYLDTVVPYAAFLDDGETPVDSPATHLRSPFVRYEVSDNFTMYMMFEPLDGIWVPLRAVNWYWHGIATNGPSGWQLASSPNDHSINPPDYDNQTYPVWNNNVTHYHWNPQLPP